MICDERREQPKKHEPIVGRAFDQWKRAANGGERRLVRAGSALLGWAFVSVRVRVSLPLRTGRVRCYILDYTDAKSFEVINGAQHGCGRVVNGSNAACISSVVVTSWCSCRITLSHVCRRQVPCCRRWYDVIECRCRWCRACVTVSSSSSFSLLFLSPPSSLSYAVRHASCYTRDKV